MLKVVFTIFLMTQLSQAGKLKDLSFSDHPTVKLVKKNNFHSNNTSYYKSQWSLIVPSFVIHGLKPTGEASDVMPRKMDKQGSAVITPGLGMKYEGPNGELFVTGMVKDCYDNLAGTIQYGHYSILSKDSRWGLSFGLYFRETPISCSTTGFGNFQTTECHTMDKYPLKFQTSLNGAPVDLIPMPFFHYSTSIYRDQDLQINFKMMSNIVLNEFAIAVPF